MWYAKAHEDIELKVDTYGKDVYIIPINLLGFGDLRWLVEKHRITFEEHITFVLLHVWLD
jgi:hypothetical protein